MALGISGGVLPCPEALSVLLLAIGLGRIVLGVGVILAFSVGLAAALIAIGLSLVRARAVLARRAVLPRAVLSRGMRRGPSATAPAALQRWIPLASAAIVTLLGVGMAWRGIGNFTAL